MGGGTPMQWLKSDPIAAVVLILGIALVSAPALNV
jgi:hypothetical protein